MSPESGHQSGLPTSSTPYPLLHEVAILVSCRRCRRHHPPLPPTHFATALLTSKFEPCTSGRTDETIRWCCGSKMAQRIKILATKLNSPTASWQKELIAPICPLTLHKLWFPSEALYLSQAYKMPRFWWLVGLHSVICHVSPSTRCIPNSNLAENTFMHWAILLLAQCCVPGDRQQLDGDRCQWQSICLPWERPKVHPSHHKRQAGQWSGRQEAYTLDPVTSP